MDGCHVQPQEFVTKLPAPKKFTEIQWRRSFQGIGVVERKGQAQCKVYVLVKPFGDVSAHGCLSGLCIRGESQQSDIMVLVGFVLFELHGNSGSFLVNQGYIVQVETQGLYGVLLRILCVVQFKCNVDGGFALQRAANKHKSQE